jgi:hypothetical protein
MKKPELTLGTFHGGEGGMYSALPRWEQRRHSVIVSHRRTATLIPCCPNPTRVLTLPKTQSAIASQSEATADGGEGGIRTLGTREGTTP